MSDPDALGLLAFSHLCVGVSDMERSLDFYRRLLGFEVVFDVELEGPSLETVTGTGGAKGRMVGGLIAGVVVELLALGGTGSVPAGPRLGYTNMSFSVRDLDAAHAAASALGAPPPHAPVEIGGVRMCFLHDPDGTPIELVEFPHGERNSAELWGHGRSGPPDA